MLPSMRNFNIKFHDEMYESIEQLAARSGSSMAEIIRNALSLYGRIADEYDQGAKLLIQRGDDVKEWIVPSLERPKPRREVVP